MRSAFGDVERPIKATNTFSFQIPVCSLHTGKYRQVISQEVNKIKTNDRFCTRLQLTAGFVGESNLIELG